MKVWIRYDNHVRYDTYRVIVQDTVAYNKLEVIENIKHEDLEGVLEELKTKYPDNQMCFFSY